MSSSNTSPRTDALRLVLGLALPLLLVASNARDLAAFTIDDAYISFRYARNLVNGLGLVYNPGEPVEGYTNFLWTLLLAGSTKLGLGPVIAAKLMGTAAIFGIMTLFYIMSGSMFCIANWLLATSVSFQGHSLLGLEGGLFVFLMLLGTYLMTKEGRSIVPAIVFGLAALTRPEAPAYFLIALATLSREAKWRRLLVFFAIVGAHVAWRHHYYGTWLPNTLAAKTGNLSAQFFSSIGYLRAFFVEAGPLLVLFVFGGAFAWSEGDRRIAAIAALALFNLANVMVVGADWMPGWRYLMPFEVFGFLVADFGARRLLESKLAGVRLGTFVLLILGLVQRWDGERRTRAEFAGQEIVWNQHARASGRWLAAHAAPGAVALGDIGEVGWLTNWPIYDLLGLVTPAVAKLPGGYGRKSDTPGFVEEFYKAAPRWFLLITDRPDCRHSPFPVMRTQADDPRFAHEYDFAHAVRLGVNSAWCFYQRTPEAAMRNRTVVFDFEDPLLPGWTRYGDAFAEGTVHGALGSQQYVIGAVGARIVNSFHAERGDRATGILESPAFKLTAANVALRVGGGAGFETRVELLVDGAAVRAAFGDDTEDLRRVVWDVREFAGKTAVLRVVDQSTAGWGHILVDQVEQFDESGSTH